ncbi:hypothetical protein CCMA1212_005052 [Trichoderma ghanense]|uniref:Uncharacterized protein n=1 Tax=Trichoderma ghanense TaxID=65468 RepID=A0ABY2H3K9_9HYPO
MAGSARSNVVDKEDEKDIKSDFSLPAGVMPTSGIKFVHGVFLMLTFASEAKERGSPKGQQILQLLLSSQRRQTSGTERRQVEAFVRLRSSTMRSSQMAPTLLTKSVPPVPTSESRTFLSPKKARPRPQPLRSSASRLSVNQTVTDPALARSRRRAARPVKAPGPDFLHHNKLHAWGSQIFHMQTKTTFLPQLGVPTWL